jgi:preprotein translocase subunit SecE
MNRLKEYYRQVHLELTQKTSWPTWAELQSSAVIVMVASLIIAVVVSAMDGVFSSLMTVIYSIV